MSDQGKPRPVEYVDSYHSWSPEVIRELERASEAHQLREGGEIPSNRGPLYRARGAGTSRREIELAGAVKGRHPSSAWLAPVRFAQAVDGNTSRMRRLLGGT